MNKEDVFVQDIQAQLETYLSTYHKQEFYLKTIADEQIIRLHVMQCYLLLKVLDRLDCVNTNLIDIEDEVSKLNPIYK